MTSSPNTTNINIVITGYRRPWVFFWKRHFCLQVWLRNTDWNIYDPFFSLPHLGSRYFSGSVRRQLSDMFYYFVPVPLPLFPPNSWSIFKNYSKYQTVFNIVLRVTICHRASIHSIFFFKRNICPYLIIFSFAPPWNFDFRFVIGVRAAGQGELQPFPPPEQRKLCDFSGKTLMIRVTTM